jgi:hypothetical protein
VVVTAPLEQAEAPDRLDLLVHLVLQGLVGLLEHQEALVLLGQEDLLEQAAHLAHLDLGAHRELLAQAALLGLVVLQELLVLAAHQALAEALGQAVRLELLGQEDLLEPAVLRGLQALVVHLELRGLQEQVALVLYMQAALLLL